MKEIEVLKQQIEDLIEEINDQCKWYKRKMEVFKRRQEYFRITILILSILTPAFITYFSFVPTESYFGFIAILVTALGGSIATLQSQFDFTEKYIRNASNYLNTYDLNNKTNSEYGNIKRLKSENEFEVYHRYSSLIEKSRGELIDIRRADIQAEIQLVKERKPIEIDTKGDGILAANSKS